MDTARLRELLARIACPLCGGTSFESLLLVVETPRNGGGRVRAQCVRCYLSWAFELSGEPPGEQPPPGSGGPITADELIEVHGRLADLDGPLADLVGRRA